MKFLKVTSVDRCGKAQDEIIRIDLIDRIWAYNGATNGAMAILVLGGEYENEQMCVSQTVDEIFQGLHDG